MQLGGPPDETYPGENGVPFGFFGYNEDFTHEHDPTYTLTALAGGAQVLRLPISWCNAEPTNNDYAWLHPDRDLGKALYNVLNWVKVARIGGADIKVIPVLFNSAKWLPDGTINNCGQKPAPPPRKYESGKTSWTPAAYADWRDFIGDFTTWANSDDFGIEAIEIWNEPNLEGFWYGPDRNPEWFAELFASAVEAVKDVDPNMLLVPGGLSPAPALGNRDATNNPYRFTTNFLSSLETMDAVPGSEDLVNAIGAISLHLYGAGLTPTASEAYQDMVVEYRAVRDAFAGHLLPIQKAGSESGPGIPLWITEIGFPAATYTTPLNSDNVEVRGDPKLKSPNPTKQARRLCVQWMRFSGLASMFLVHRVFDDPDHELPADFGAWGRIEDKKSDPSGTPRKAYRTLQALEGRQYGKSRCSTIVSGA